MKKTKFQFLLQKKAKFLMGMFLLGVLNTFGQSGTITGSVTDESGQPLPGANVIIKNSSTGSTVNFDGEYSIKASPSDVLVFSFVGYLTKEVVAGSQSTINVLLEENASLLDEIVVVGYGEQSRVTLTGSISTTKGEELTRSPQPNLSGSFAGRLSGVVALNRSGEPGVDGSTIRIRGISTTGNNDPLIVIDGVANRLGGMDRLDPNDIENVSVLKDASAAIYGAQAANGVILITTKRGKIGKPSLSFTYNQGFVKPTSLPDMADSPTYAQLINEINYYRSPTGGMNQIYSNSEIDLFRNGSDPDNYPNSNWVDATIKDFALQDNQSLSLRGGSEHVSYYASVSRVHQESIFKKGITEFDQINLRSNLDINVSKNLKIGVDLTIRKEDRVYPTTGANDVFRAIYRTYPTIPIRYSNGLPSAGVESGANPIVLVTGEPGTDKTPSSIFNTLLSFEYKIPKIEGLSVTGYYSEDRISRTRKQFSLPFTVYQIDNSSDPATFNDVVGGPLSGTPELFQRQENQSLVTTNLMLKFERKFDEHSLKTFVAYEQQKDEFSQFDATRKGFLSSQIPEFNQGGLKADQSSNDGYSSESSRQNYFGRVSYDYSSKYLAEVQLRYDGSSRFSKDNRWGFFPSVSVGWRLSEEDWFKSDVINSFKIKSSYGLLGNDRIDPFQYLNTFTLRGSDFISANQSPLPIFLINQLANPNITWETAKKFDVGIDVGIFDHFDLELDYFSETRSDLLTARQGSLPSVSGIVNEFDESSIIPQENIGEVKNQGFEAVLNYNNSFGDFKLYGNANFTYNKNEVVFLDDTEGMPEYQLGKGKPLGAELLYDAIGIFRTADDLADNPTLPGQQLGDLMYRDVDDNGEINALDRVRQDVTNVPQIIYGITLGAEYKNFDFNVLFQGQAKSVQYTAAESGEVGNFFSSWADNRWSPSNPNGTYPRVDVRTSSSINEGQFRNNFWLQNTAFLRIKNIELGYNLPLSSTSKIKSARVYINGFNVATFTKAKDIDPEGNSGSGQFYPQQKIFNLGINVNL